MDANLTSMKPLRGALWPELRKVACPNLQEELGCDRIVANFFDAKFIAAKIPQGVPTVIVEAESEKWLATCQRWRNAEREEDARRSQGAVLHPESDEDFPWLN